MNEVLTKTIRDKFIKIGYKLFPDEASQEEILRTADDIFDIVYEELKNEGLLSRTTQHKAGGFLGGLL